MRKPNSQKSVTVTQNSTDAYTQATVGVTASNKKPATDYRKMENSALVTEVKQAVTQRNKYVDSLISSETEVQRIDRDILWPAIVVLRKRYNDCKTPAEKKAVVPGCKNLSAFLKSIKLSTSILRVRDFRERNKLKTAVELLRLTEEAEGTKPPTIQGTTKPTPSTPPPSPPPAPDSKPEVDHKAVAVMALLNGRYPRADAEKAVDLAIANDATLATYADTTNLIRAAVAVAKHHLHVQPVPSETPEGIRTRLNIAPDEPLTKLEDEAAETETSEPSATRTKDAIIELYSDEGGTMCSAYDKDKYPDAYSDGADPVFSDTLDLGCFDDSTPEAEFEAKQTKESQQVTLQVLGWLWTHGYRSAAWGEELSGEGKPGWAKQDVYRWDDSPTKNSTEERFGTLTESRKQLRLAIHQLEQIRLAMQLADLILHINEGTPDTETFSNMVALAREIKAQVSTPDAPKMQPMSHHEAYTEHPQSQYGKNS